MQAGNRSGLSSELQRMRFNFDQVFSPTASQSKVFEEVQPLIQSAIDGYKVRGMPICMPPASDSESLKPTSCAVIQVCIMAYGQTGSGKTYTMMGSEG